jgi:hypothetical protein
MSILNPMMTSGHFLSTIQRISHNRIEEVISEIGEGNELGVLKQDEEEGPEKPWETSKTKIELQRDDFPERIEIVRANMAVHLKGGDLPKGDESAKTVRVL